MKNPPLSDSDFKMDAILLRWTLVKPEDVTNCHEFELKADRMTISGNDSVTIHSALKSRDLSAFNFLILIMRNVSDHPLLVEVKIKHVSPVGARDQECYAFSGGREVLHPGPVIELGFPFNCFGKYGKQSDWKNVEELEITFRHDKFFSGSRNLKIEFHSLDIEKRLFPEGPRLTDQGLERLLIDWRSIDESPFTRNAESTLFSSNKTSVDFRNSIIPFSAQDPDLYSPPPHFYPVGTPSDVLNGRIMGQQVDQNLFWEANPLGELEWSHFLHRHHFLRSLVKGYVQTGEERIVPTIDSIVKDWILAHPAPVGSNGGAGPTWETLTVAWRLREWFWIMGTIWPHHLFSTGTKKLMFRSIWEHAQSLMDHQGHPNNWIIVESSALALVGLLFPVFRDSTTWFETGLGRLFDQLKCQFFPDGAHFEISPLYHAICINALLEVTRVAEFTGHFLPSSFYKTLEKGFEYLMNLARPNFTWPSINDSAGIDRNYSQILFNAASVFNRPDFEWMASNGKSGIPPNRSGLRIFQDVGICVIRTVEENRHHWALFRAGPAGAFHAHNDLLSFEIFDGATPWLVDPGITGYAPGMLTSHYRSALAHNAVVVDGIEPLRNTQPIQERIKPRGDSIKTFEGANFMAVTGVSKELSDLQGNSSQLKRTLILLKRRIWILVENISGTGSHEIVHNWQFSSHVDTVELVERNHIVAAGKSMEFCIQMVDPRLNLEIDWACGVLDPPRGWVSIGGTDQPAYSVHCQTMTQLPCRFCWLIYDPKNTKDRPLFVEIELSTANMPEIVVHFESQAIERLSMPVEFCF